MKVTAIIERAKDGTYNIYTQEDVARFGMMGYGDTVQAAKDDFFALYKEYKEMYGDEMPDLEVTFKYDVASFLQSVSKRFSLAGLQTITGINQKQLGHYLSGHRKPSAATVKKIEESVHQFAQELSEYSFA
jgi:PDZ domain-containing secreted protein